MSEKLDMYISRSNNEVQRFSNDLSYYFSFLKTSSRLYKYNFKDQVLIHSQRPDAVACAEYDLWRSKDIDRYVQRGSKGIALVDEVNGKPALRYVFDFSDTRGRNKQSKGPFLWKISEDNKRIAANALDNNGTDLADVLLKKAHELAVQHSSEHIKELMWNKEGSFLEELDELNVQVRYRKLLEASIGYVLLSRCGIDAENYIENDDFSGLYEFNTSETMCELGTAVSDLSEEVLRTIEKTLKNYERNKNYERSNITENNHGERNRVRSGRGNSDISPELGNSGAEEHRKVRTAAADVSQREPQRNVSGNADVRKAEQPFSGNGRSSASEVGADNLTDEGGSRSNRRTERTRPNEMGGNDEQHSVSGGRNNNERADLHLSQYSAEKAVSDVDTAYLSGANQQMTFDEIIGAPEEQPKENEEKITAVRVGDFYEFYGDEAKIAAEKLGLTLTSRNGEPMVGVPYHALDSYTKKLEKAGYSIEFKELQSIENSAEELAKAPQDIEINSAKTVLPMRETAYNAQKHDFIISDEHLGEGGAKSKFKANTAAIRLLNQLEDEKRLANPDEQRILSQYTGWGGLPQAFDEHNSDWSAEYLELKALLSPDEYESARGSTLNAHYTTPTVINAIYEGLSNLGFETGNVLEPSMGVGNFFGAMPEEMRSSRLYGVELDSITGRIAKQLYQNADIQVTGFEKTTFPDNFFDVAVGNVPFGAYKLAEKRYDKLNLNIHDHFFAKALDKVRAGGVVAFVTSKGTLDKANPQFRKYLAQRAELLGAIRLPNNAFKANAGTEVTSDIIFLQKRDKMLDIEPDWVNLGETADGVPVNKYFEEHPEMILGEMKKGLEFSLYGNSEETACVPFEDADLKELLKGAVSHIQGEIPEIEAPAQEEAVESIPASPDVKNFSYTVIDDKLYFRENSRMFIQDLPGATEERVKGMVEIRDCVRKLIDYQLNEYSDYAIQSQQAELNKLYDNFTKKYGLLNSTANSRAFSEDDSYHLLTSLEHLDDMGNLKRKSDMFTKRTIKQRAQMTSVDTASEALAVSISEKARVDVPFMAQLAKKSENEIVSDLQGVIYRVPAAENEAAVYVTADEYLSGNIRSKLAQAKLAVSISDEYEVNVKALEQAMPKPLEASEIDVRLGATWIDTATVKQFMNETFNTPFYLQSNITVSFSKYTSEWQIDGKNSDKNNTKINETFGTPRKNAYSIIEDTLNLRDARVYDRVEDVNGSVKSVLNKKETMLAQAKQEAIKNAFKEWIFRDPERREKLVEKYNVLFNSSRPREYNGSHINFVGINPEITLRTHQRNAIAHTMYGNNTLLAHQVGAGKSFEMIASAMESKRLGLCTKSLFVVPNHLTEQMGAEFLRLYPAANILVATKKDFEAKNRKRLCAKIATGDYDAVIIGHSQLEKIPISPERQERMIRKQIEEITDGINSLGHSQRARFSVKQLEKTKKSLEAKLEKLTGYIKRDDVVTFEELGIDKLFVDEAHSFKNLFLYTKMRNVAGIQQTEAQKSADLYMKCQYMDEITGGKGVVFATGTPIAAPYQH